MGNNEWKTIKTALLGSLVTLALAGIYQFIVVRTTLSTLVEAQSEYVKRDVLEVTLKTIQDDILENKETSKGTDRNVRLIMSKLKIEATEE